MIKRFFFSFLFFNMLPFFDAQTMEKFEERVTAPFLKAKKGKQELFIFGTVHELPLSILQNANSLKECISQCDVLFVENNHAIPLSKAKEKTPIKYTIEGKRRIKVVFQQAGIGEAIENYDLFSQTLALTMYNFMQGMDSELIKEFKKLPEKEIISLDKCDTREDHEREILAQMEPSLEEPEKVLNRVYQQELEKEPVDDYRDLLNAYMNFCQKLREKIPFEYEEPDDDNTRKRTKEWIRQKLAPYFKKHPHDKIGIVVGGLHLEDLLDWLTKQDFKVELKP